MPVVVVSLHERDAPLELLERLAFSEEELPKALAGLGDSPHLSEAVILSTCMRTEVYAVAERFHDGVADICCFLGDHLGAGTASAALAEALAVEYDESAVRHLFAVSSGIDSPVLGEGEVLRQVRAATSAPGRRGPRARSSTACSVTPSRSASAPGPRPGSPGASPRSPTSRWRSRRSTSAGRWRESGSSSSALVRWARDSSARWHRSGSLPTS